MEFIDKVVGGAISKQYIPAVHKGVSEAMAVGGVYGYPVVDLCVELLDGKEHPVDSSEMAFRAAGRQALRLALEAGQPTLLEPFSTATVVVPTECLGDTLSDLSARRGRVRSSESLGPEEQLIVASVPESEMLRYAIDLRSLTAGHGRFSLNHEGYEVVPEPLVAELTRDAPAFRPG